MTDRFYSLVGFVTGIGSLIILSATLFSYGTLFNDIEKATGFWGIVVSAVALGTSCYLIFLAADVYKKLHAVSELEKQTKINEELLAESQTNLKELAKSQNHFFETQKLFADTQKNFADTQESLVFAQKNFAESIWDSYTLQLVSLGKIGGAAPIATEIRRSRGKLGYYFQILEKGKRKTCFDDLATVGEREDIVLLTTIASDTSESDEIKNAAQDAIEWIKQRLP